MAGSMQSFLAACIGLCSMVFINASHGEGVCHLSFWGVSLAEHISLSSPLCKSFIDLNRRAVGSTFCAVHGGTHGHGQRDIVLHLLGAPVFACQIVIDHAHLFCRAAREIGDEVWDHELFFACGAADPLEYLAEAFEYACFPFAHQFQDGGIQMFGGDAKLARHMIADDFFGLAGLQ